MNSPTLEAPTVSMSVASSRFGISRMAPFGRARGASAMFTGEVRTWRSLVTGNTTAKAEKERACTTQAIWWARLADPCGNK